MACSICGGTRESTHTFREMMFGTRDLFQYAECEFCGALQITNPPSNWDRYYPETYYSFAGKGSALRLLSYRLHLHAARYVRPLRSGGGSAFRPILDIMPPHNAKILDVGSGAGELVRILRAVGYDAHGLDPHTRSTAPFIHKTDLAQVDPGWDLIMFHHSLEHMTAHVQVLKTVRDLLRPKGLALVRMPILNWAWTHYGADWVQLDVPRHLVLHTLKSFRIACDQAGLEIVKTRFDSGSLQFTGSELRKRDIPLTQARNHPFSRRDLERFRKSAKNLNARNQGDQAAFYLRPKPESCQGRSFSAVH